MDHFLAFLSVLNFICAGYLFGTVIFNHKDMDPSLILVFLVMGCINLAIGLI